MLATRYAAHRQRAGRLAARLMLCMALSFPGLAAPPPAAISAEPPTTLTTGVIPTMGIGDVTEGALLFRSGRTDRYIPAPILKTDVQIVVTGTIARATVTQEFTNPRTRKGDRLEGIYVFPLPETAAVDQLRMKVGERVIEGQIKERNEAKRTYEQAKQDGTRTSLVEQERPNIFTTSVANIEPGERIIVEIEYQETVRYENGQFRLRFPMAVGPRYIPGTPVVIEGQAPRGSGTMPDTDRVPDASRITPPVMAPEEGRVNPLSLSVTLSPGFPVEHIESLYHPIITIPDADQHYHISVKEETVPSDRDFQLTWRQAPRTQPLATIFTEQKNGDTYALLMLVPPTQPDANAPQVPRDLTFIIDTSGSMAGASIEQAKRSLAAALTRLTAQDRFNIIQFNNQVRSLFAAPQPVSISTIKQAVRYTEHLTADGGTEVLPALRQALNSPQDASRLQQLLLLTDGQIGNEDELFELVQHRIGTRRLFTIGIGATPNSYVMRKAAEFGRGTFTYIGKIEEVKETLDALLKKLERPVLSDITLDGSGWSTLEPYPATIGDLYEGEPIVLAIKSASLPEQATLRGKTGNVAWTLPVSIHPATAQGGLSISWARQKISALMDDAYKGTPDDAVRRAVLDVALSHHLVSRYTSLVAVDVTPSRPTDAPAAEQDRAMNPARAQDQALLAGLPKTATGVQWHLLLGLSALLSTALLWKLRTTAG
jgi:Ca-activated chloride channel family protein